ncbi:hypothetical protein [Vibrio intestinalis]|uniref:hypothetical protein n=1 Tax=Vibrio intestinalis TaxID=2933291 RepID=UPI0021A41692|nr:hypothetical protein [Vibrio intestinalis]
MKSLIAALITFSFVPHAIAESEPIDRFAEKQTSHVLEEVYGDLDRDGIDEKVVILDSGLMGDFGTLRSILIYKNTDDGWQLMHYSDKAVLPSLHGGIMGDPFNGLSIERGALVIRHFGGSMQKWNYVHRFRLEENQWRLIGATINYGILQCEYFEFDYNLLTGNAIYKDVLTGCREGEEASTKRTQLHIDKPTQHNMDSFYPGGNEIYLPKLDKTIYY